MSNDKLSLETRVSSAFVQGQLDEIIRLHEFCECSCGCDIQEVLNDWKQAEAELKASKGVTMTDNEIQAIINEREACGGCPQCPPLPYAPSVVMEYVPLPKETGKTND